MKQPKTIVIVQARMTSSRLPGKMMRLFTDIPLFEYVYNRCMRMCSVENIILATSSDSSDNVLAKAAMEKGIPIFRGPLADVRRRYIECAEKEKAEIIIRICGDSPFVDIECTHQLLMHLIQKDIDYVQFSLDRCISGLDSEIVRLSALSASEKHSSHSDDREHVTYHIRNHPQLYSTSTMAFNLNPFNSDLSLTVDTEEDFLFCSEVAARLIEHIGYGNYDFTSNDVFYAIETIRSKQVHHEHIHYR